MQLEWMHRLNWLQTVLRSTGLVILMVFSQGHLYVRFNVIVQNWSENKCIITMKYWTIVYCTEPWEFMIIKFMIFTYLPICYVSKSRVDHTRSFPYSYQFKIWCTPIIFCWLWENNGSTKYMWFIDHDLLRKSCWDWQIFFFGGGG